MENILLMGEDRKYSDLWENGYNDARWGKLAGKVIKLKKEYSEDPSLIDFGFGTGNSMDFFEKKGLNVSGTEINSYSIENQRKKGRKVYHTSLDDLSMLKNNQFNIGFCNDVIEHVPTNLVDKSLEEMTRICSDYLFISVCPNPSHHLSLDGENLHLTVRPKEWWEKKFENYGDVKRIKFFLNKSLRYLISLKMDKN